MLTVKTLKLIVVCLMLSPRLKCDRNSNMLAVGHATKCRSQQKEIIKKLPVLTPFLKSSARITR